MLEVLRRHMKTIIWAIVAVFIGGFVLLQLSTQRMNRNTEKSYAVKINNKKIGYDEFLNIYREYSEQYRKKYGAGFDEQMSDELKKNITNSLIFSELMYQEARKNKIEVTETEVEEAIRAYYFQNNPSHYEQAKKMLPKTWWSTQRNEMCKRLFARKLEFLIRNSVKISDEDLCSYYKKRKSSAKIRYIKVSNDSFKNVVLSDEEIAEYYDRHKSEYYKKDQVKTAFLAARKPSEEDIADSATRNKITANLKKTMDKALEEMEGGSSLNSVGKKYSLDIDETPLFERTQFMDNPDFQIFVAAAFTLSDPGEFTDVVESQNYFYIISMVKRIDAHTPLLKDIEKDLKKALLEAKRDELAKKEVSEIEAKIKSGGEKDLSSQIKTTPSFIMEDDIPGLKKDSHLKTEILRLKTGVWSKPLKISDGYCLIEVTERKIPSKIDRKEVEGLNKELLQIRQYLMLEEWYKSLQDNAKIENNVLSENKEQTAEEEQ